MLVSTGKATLTELQTVYGAEDAYDLLEVIMVDAANARLTREYLEAEQRRNAHGSR